jgi:hypothetical protein
MVRVVAAVVALVAGTSLPAAGRAAAVIPEGLVIRVYDNAGILPSDRTRAIARAREILARAELDAEWLDCPARGVKAAWACAAPLGWSELVVRLARAPARDANAKALGSSVIDARTGVGTFATVYVDRVELVAQQGRTDVSTMIGRLMAHEVGHLLLGTNNHSNTGLMREIWTLAELTRNNAQDWTFLPTQLETLRASQLTVRRGTTAAGTRRGTKPTPGG